MSDAPSTIEFVSNGLISSDHLRLLAEHAIDQRVAESAGLYSITEVSGLPEEFAHYGASVVPALAFLWTSFDGSTVVQLRPDRPVRDDEGMPRKYLFPREGRAHWAIEYLAQAGAIDRPKRGDVVISAIGRQLLADRPDVIVEADLVHMPGFQGWVERSKESARVKRSSASDGIVAPALVSDETPL